MSSTSPRVRPLRRLGIVSALLLAALALTATASAASVRVFATGLNNPRGLKFGPDGNLYLAEGGLGGSLMTTPEQCPQVAPIIGPYTGGVTADIVRFTPNGKETVVASGLPSDQTGPARNFRSGVADVAFIDHRLYALLAGAGCSHGHIDVNNGIIRVNHDGTTTQVADLSTFIKAHPVANPDPADFEPDGTWYSMLAVHGDLYAVEPNHGEVDRFDPWTGQIRRVVDVSATQGHIVPTALAYDHGNLFLGNLGEFPVTPGSETVFKLTPSGNLKPDRTNHDPRTRVRPTTSDVRTRDLKPNRRTNPRHGRHRPNRPIRHAHHDRLRPDLPHRNDHRPGRRPLGLQPRIRPDVPRLRTDPANRPKPALTRATAGGHPR